jgi:exodeoxyribonuclease-5
VTTLTQDQQTATEQINTFLADPKGTAMLLEGGAGVGKTFLIGQILQKHESKVRCVAAPTHKACNVLRRKLDGFGVPWMRGFDEYFWDGHMVITGTTAALLGIGPVVTDDQTTEVSFGKTSRGILGKVQPTLLVIDEVSMLGWYDFSALRDLFKARSCKIIAVGDAGQLPPVKKGSIPFDKFVNKAALREIVRQAAGSKIVELAWAIREGKPWTKIKGKGVKRVVDVGAAFIAALSKGVKYAELPEEDRPVFIAYRNVVVDVAQEKACRKLYGHSHKAFAPGELVLSETNLYVNKVLLCANQDELVVEGWDPEHRDSTLGVPVILRQRGGRRGCFESFYLSPEELANKQHPFNVELRAKADRAQKLQEQVKAIPHGNSLRNDLDQRRKAAWREFFDWRDQTIVSFRHPFAITSHKSQGSTYHTVFADTADLGAKSSQALYVAVTRPREELVLT